MKNKINLIFSRYLLLICYLAFSIFSSYLSAATTSRFLPNPKVPDSLPDFLLFDYDFKPVRNSHLKGKWTLFYFGYLSCPDVCPTTLQTLNKSMQLLKNKPMAKNIQVIFVSLDPWRDTPEKIKQYVQYFNPEFIGASADTPQLNILTNFFKIIYYNNRTDNRSTKYAVAHSDQVILVNPKAEFSGQFNTPLDSELIAEDLIKIISGSYND